MKFAVIGVGGYIAIRHIKAIKDTGNQMVASLDPFDSVGYLDSYFPDSDYFREFERFERHIDKLRRTEAKVDYISICSPNYLHDAHIRFALRNQAHAICEKPLVLNPWNIEGLQEIEKETGKKIYNILQLRLHPSIIELKEKIQLQPKDKIFDIDLVYITSRGRWYNFSWKGDEKKSGGITTNIGIHFFDMLAWIFGKTKSSTVHVAEEDKASGYMELERARVRWFLSTSEDSLPKEVREKGQRTYRSIKIENEEIHFSDGFTDLHTQSYQHILSGKGFGLNDAKESINMVYSIRNAKPIGLIGDYHPILKTLESNK